MWEEISPVQLQAELRNVFAANPCLRTPDLQADFDPVFALPANSDAERVAVKKALCDRLGLITQKRVPGRPSLEEGIRFQKDVEVGGDADRELLLVFLLFFFRDTLEISGCFIIRTNTVRANCVESVGAFQTPPREIRRVPPRWLRTLARRSRAELCESAVGRPSGRGGGSVGTIRGNLAGEEERGGYCRLMPDLNVVR